MTNAPKCTTDSPTDKKGQTPSFFRRISSVLSGQVNADFVVPTSTSITLRSSVRIARTTQSFALQLGNASLEFHVDMLINGVSSQEWIIHPGEAFYRGVPQFIRLGHRDDVLFGRLDDLQSRIYGYDASVADRHVRITNSKGDLTIQLLELERPTRISAIRSQMPVWAARNENLRRLPEVIGRHLAQFGDDEALDIIREVNDILATEIYRDSNDEGAPGGIIRFPGNMPVLIVGDLHARVNNLLRVITEGGTLRALERGEACLVLLGDLVHSEEKGKLRDMGSSILMLDLFCMLKRRFPKCVFYIHGNHESFSSEVAKGGVPQGLIFREYLKKRRGEEYLAEVETLFDSLAYIVHGNEFAACHGGPVRAKVTRNTLVNIHRYPGLQSEIIWNRLRQGNRPVGYGKGSVKRFRKLLNLSKNATLVVGHTPMSATDTIWRDIGGIVGHHIIYSAHTHRLAAMLMHDGHATTLEFVPEPALELLNGEDET